MAHSNWLIVDNFNLHQLQIIASDADDKTIRLIIHWKGGVHTELVVNRPRPATAQKTSMEALEIIRRMAVRYGDDQIASVLNRLGHRTGKEMRWNQNRVKTARRNHSIPGQARAVPDPDILTLTQAAKHCGVSNKTIERLVEAGKLRMQQVAPRAPWEIDRADLESEPVATIIKQLRRTGKLMLDGGDSADQLSLLIENTGDDNARHHE
jgi:excisionase family DNA binding protein